MGWGGEALSFPPSPHTFVKLFRVILQHQWYRQASPGEPRQRKVLGKLQERSEGAEWPGPADPTPALTPFPARARGAPHFPAPVVFIYMLLFFLTFLLLLSADRIWSIKGGRAAGPPALNVRGGERGRERCL